jgi:hypothetical protein
MKLLLAASAAALLAIVNVAAPGEKKSDAKGTLTIEGKTYTLVNALAYEQIVFKKQEIALILSEKPLDTAKLKQSLKKNGNDDDFFPLDPHVKLSLDGAGELLQLSIHVGGANIIRSGDRNVQTKITIQEGVVKGTSGMTKADTFRDKPFKFDVSFDVKLMKP